AEGKPSSDLAFTPDGRTLVAFTHDGERWGVRKAFLFDVADRRLRRVVVMDCRATSTIYSPDGRMVVTLGNGDRRPGVWDAETGRELGRLGDEEVADVSFTPDGKQLLTEYLGTESRVVIWDAATRQPLRRCPVPERELREATVVGAADGRSFLVRRPNG